jgi:membrane-associated phospholipid phosphatase
MEKSFIINLQKLPKPVFKIMNIISVPFHLKFFSIIMMILYYHNLITSSQVFLLISSQLIVGVIKYIVRRVRPYNEHKKIKNKDWTFIDYYSFPSGHTFNAFLLFYILYENKIITNYLMFIPYLVALSRLALGVHYPTDVLGGAILAKLIFRAFSIGIC